MSDSPEKWGACRERVLRAADAWARAFTAYDSHGAPMNAGKNFDVAVIELRRAVRAARKAGVL